MARLVNYAGSEHAPVRSVTTRSQKVRHSLPWGHVTTQQLKEDAERGIEYFWSRRPSALRPPSGNFLDFSKAGNA